MVDETDDMNKLYIIFLKIIIFWLPDSQFFISEVSVNTVMYAAQGIQFIFTQIPLSYTQKESG